VGREPGDVFAAEEDGAGVGIVESGEGAEKGGFAASGRAEEEEEFARGDFEGDVVEDFFAGEGFDDVGDGYGGGHGFSFRSEE
jgi:hypothetical protein